MNRDCFGELWEERAPECCGGREPATGMLHTRCNVYEQCGRTFRMNQASKQLMATSPQHYRPAQTSPGAAVPVNVGSRPYSVPQPAPQRPGYTPQAYPYQQHLPSQVYPAVYHPTMNLLPNEAASFLTVLEPQQDGMSRFGALLAEAARAGLKGVLMQSTYLIDHTPFRTK
jgi:hypothetical protein